MLVEDRYRFPSSYKDGCVTLTGNRSQWSLFVAWPSVRCSRANHSVGLRRQASIQELSLRHGKLLYTSSLQSHGVCESSWLHVLRREVWQGSIFHTDITLLGLHGNSTVGIHASNLGQRWAYMKPLQRVRICWQLSEACQILAIHSSCLLPIHHPRFPTAFIVFNIEEFVPLAISIMLT